MNKVFINNIILKKLNFLKKIKFIIIKRFFYKIYLLIIII